MRNPMNYGKAKGIVLLNKYLPRVTPFKNIDIISNLKEWESIKDRHGSFVPCRMDMPIGQSMKNVVPGANGSTNEIPALIEKINKQSNGGVLLLIPTKEPGCPRYLYDGGFNSVFTIEGSLIVEFVGKAFDGHELTQGLAVHERFIIPWDELLFVEKRIDLMKNEAIAKFKVSHDAYIKQRDERIAFLTSDCHYNAELVNINVPNRYQPLKDSLVSNFFNDIVFELIRQKHRLLEDKLYRFAVQGNFVDGKAQPWEIFRTERWL